MPKLAQKTERAIQKSKDIVNAFLVQFDNDEDKLNDMFDFIFEKKDYVRTNALKLKEKDLESLEKDVAKVAKEANKMLTDIKNKLETAREAIEQLQDYHDHDSSKKDKPYVSEIITQLTDFLDAKDPENTLTEIEKDIVGELAEFKEVTNSETIHKELAKRAFLKEKALEKLKKKDKITEDLKKRHLTEYAKHDTDDYDPGTMFGTQFDIQKIQDVYKALQKQNPQLDPDKDYSGPNEKSEKFYKDYIRKYGKTIRKGFGKYVTPSLLQNIIDLANI